MDPKPLLTSTRLQSLDAYRGFVMLLMMAEVLRFHKIHEALPNSDFWSFMAYHQDHVAWAGCSLHDLIQPSFSFLVGVALPYSLASRQAGGQSVAVQWRHALWRSLLLVLLGVFLRSIGSKQTYFTFEDTLSQIGLGYPVLFALGFTTVARQWLAFGGLVAGYWLVSVLYPAPGPDFPYETVGVPANWPHHYTGLMAHFNKNSNLAWAFDTWFLNLFPREKPFLFNGGGYATLSFIPTLATMVLGLLAGQWLRTGWPVPVLLRRLLLAAGAGILLGVLAQWLGLCPVVKRIWTPAWVLFSGGCCFALLTLFYYVIDVRKHQRWAYFLIVIGTNSIAAYCIAHFIESFVVSSFYTHFGPAPFLVFGPAYEPLLLGMATLLIYWLILRWLYKRRIFIKI
ncbi:acyltransferase family protein [Spirosoma montaniterrae]|uniref:DUF5009 domain-containing protein n=1 Tax=Spirosoma montaniterrae TaxID=1178516 RepID=A0A1P9X204_9BACT|nr:hypothetical protein [Spirosoma montaniterrae]AQG81664.1 hypothetical protein AWR27_21560 [Spirosoma montaniterrae]